MDALTSAVIRIMMCALMGRLPKGSRSIVLESGTWHWKMGKSAIQLWNPAGEKTEATLATLDTDGSPS